MKKMIVILSLILLAVLLFCQKQNWAEPASLGKMQKEGEITPVAQEVEERIISAIDNLKEGRAAEGANLLLDVVLLVKPREKMPKGFESKILGAKDQFKEDNVKKGVELISEALQLVKSSPNITGEKKEPVDVEQVKKKNEPFPIAKLMRDKILTAREQFKKGNADKGVILILESIQLISPVTD